MKAVAELAPTLGLGAACQAMGVWRGAADRHRMRVHRREFIGPPAQARPARPTSQIALHSHERDLILEALNSDRFVDCAPASVHATLLEEGKYLGSVRTMYRVLGADRPVRERRNQRRHPAYAKPELLATKPNEVWSWDITKLKGPIKGAHYHLYVILDIFSRYAVGWMIGETEKDALAREFIATTMERFDIREDTLTLHADRGSSMRSKCVADLLVDLHVISSHGRPHVSDDNPYSESQFKTLKYRPQFPDRFGCLQDARAYCQAFFDWYNNRHRHSGIGHMTPANVHFELAESIRLARQATMDAAFLANPHRFRNGPPRIPALPTAVWINPPKKQEPTTINRSADYSVNS